MSKCALVTGAAGFIGRHVVVELANAGYRVVGLGHGSESGLPDDVCEWHQGNIGLYNLKALKIAPDVAVHCAGGSSVSGSIADPREDRRRTVESTKDLLGHLRSFSPETRLVFVSSAAVYGTAASQPISENAPRNAESPYGRHKIMAEDEVRTYADKFGIRSAIVRLFSVYGEGLRKQLLWEACRKLSGGDLRFGGSGLERRDWLHVKDAARLLAVAAIHAGTECPIVNGGTGISVTVREILEELCRALGMDAYPEFTGLSRVGDPQCYQADVGRSGAWGWQPRIGWREGVWLYAKWFRGGL